jgi:hypothetical protein
MRYSWRLLGVSAQIWKPRRTRKRTKEDRIVNFGILRVLVLRVRRLVSKKEGASRYSGRLTVSDELFGEDQVSGASDGTLPE